MLARGRARCGEPPCHPYSAAPGRRDLDERFFAAECCELRAKVGTNLGTNARRRTQIHAKGCKAAGAKRPDPQRDTTLRNREYNPAENCKTSITGSTLVGASGKPRRLLRGFRVEPHLRPDSGKGPGLEFLAGHARPRARCSQPFDEHRP